MKPTEQEIEVLAKEYAKTHGKVRDCQFHFIKGFKQAISQMQPEWVAVDSRYDLPEVGLPVLVQTEYISSGVPCTDCFAGYLDHDGELMVYPSDDPYGWSFKECVKQWSNIPQPPTK